MFSTGCINFKNQKRMNATINKESATPVLVFNPLKRLIGVFRSLTATAQAFHTSTANIHFACTGESISACGFYFRYWNNAAITYEELANAYLPDWDKANGLTRSYYPNKYMTRNGMPPPKAK